SGGEPRQLTQDHTGAAEMVRRGVLTRDELPAHPWRHAVTNFLGGSEPGVTVELHGLDVHPGDVLLLCSDGLTDMVPDADIAAVLREEAEPRSACERLVRAANGRGGVDNVTVIVAHVT